MNDRFWKWLAIGLAAVMITPALAACVGLFTWFAITVWRDVVALL